MARRSPTRPSTNAADTSDTDAASDDNRPATDADDWRRRHAHTDSHDSDADDEIVPTPEPYGEDWLLRHGRVPR